MRFHSHLDGAPALLGESALKTEFANGSRILALPGTERTIPGLAGAALVIIDEASRVEDELLAAVRPMLATTAGGGRLIALTTPAGKRGWFFDAWTGGNDGTAPGSLHRIARALRRSSWTRNCGNSERSGLVKNTAWNFSIPTRLCFRPRLLLRHSHNRCSHYGISATMESAPVFLPRKIRYVVGVDLGQSSDPTAICVLEHSRASTTTTSDFERHTGLGEKPQVPAERIHCRHLERLPLGMSYPAVVQHIKELMARPPLNGHDQVKPAELVVDDSGVGRPVSDLLVDAGLKP